MLTGAWGARAGELLEQADERHQARVHRIGELAMLAAPDTVQDKWCCWLFGEPEDRGELSARFGLRTRAELPTAFGRALIELGECACELLGGRFVLVILDRERGRCVVTRDQLGAQPLVYTSVSDGVLFAEHERDLLDLLPSTPSPDRLALLRWIDNGLIPRGHTLYEGVQRLPAGHRLTLGEARTQVERWWSIRYQGTDQGSPMVLGERLRDAAFAAVGRAAAGSRRPAVKLSGGLDSACVAAGLTANGFADGRALAIGGTFSDHPVSDERELIEATARHTQLPLEQIAFRADSSMLTPALEHIARWRLPPATPNLFLWQPVMARARKLDVDLMLDGEGGDELFGLATYLIADRVRSGRLLGAWWLTRRIPGLGAHPDRHLRLRVLRRYGLAPLVPSAVQHRREQRRIASSGSIVPRADAQTLLDLRSASEQDRHDGPLWWRFQVESVIDLRDTFDMGGHFRREATDAAIDIRHPLLYDLPLIETALRLPPRAQFDPVRDRPLLREGLTGLIPETVRTRHEKSHFTPLVLAGMSTEEARLIEPLRGADAPLRDYVAPEALDRKLAVDPDARSMLGTGSLWRVAIANRWLVSQAG
jgi:asparagine synthase (glutamine-hydrolysing)